jgi:hypothetical protein
MMMVKAGVGVGLLASYFALDLEVIPLDLGVDIVLPMHLAVWRERLKMRPVQIVCDWLESLLGVGNPWFQPELRLDARSEHDEAIAKTLNRPAVQRLAAP